MWERSLLRPVPPAVNTLLTAVPLSRLCPTTAQGLDTGGGGRDQGAVIPPDIYDPAVNALRFLAVDAINQARSGHPGAPLDIAPVIYRLYTRHLCHDPAHPGSGGPDCRISQVVEGPIPRCAASGRSSPAPAPPTGAAAGRAPGPGSRRAGRPRRARAEPACPC